VLVVLLLVMYLCARGIDVGHLFLYKGYRCWSCLYVLGVSMLVMYFCVWGSMLVLYLCVRGMDVGYVFVC
jgi:uncharacterized membrane protein